jgi:hypothetical protein
MLAAARGEPGGEWKFAGLFAGRVFESETFGESVLARNPHFVNISTKGGGSARRFDQAVFQDRIFVAKGAGNDSLDGIADCRSYNSLCVGGYGHLSTLGPGEFDDDVHRGSWVNDPDSGREEPDVVGSYSANVPVASGTVGHDNSTGTSLATPSVLGFAALLVASHRSKLFGDPTLLRAVLMASALHPTEDSDAPDAPPVPNFNDGIDDKFGLGAPRGDVARRILHDDQAYTALRSADKHVTPDGRLVFHSPGDQVIAPIAAASPTLLTLGTTALRFSASAGRTVRVVLAWDQCADTATFMPDGLLADLDLIVTGAGQVWTNPSLVDNWEAVQFVAPTSAQYEVRVHASRWDPCGSAEARETHVALAWAVEQR